MLIDLSSPEKYWLTDSENKRFFAFAVIDDNGLVSIELRTKIVVGEVILHSSELRGKEQFHKIIQHFSGKITGIKANWSFGENLRNFNESLKKGFSIEEAVWHKHLSKSFVVYSFNVKQTNSLFYAFCKMPCYFCSPAYLDRKTSDCQRLLAIG